MTRTWKFTDLEFFVAWESAQADILPAPFVFTSRTPLYYDHQREKRAIREQLRSTLDPGFDRVLDIVARPDIRIEMHGWGRDHEDPDSQIRLLGVRRGNDGYLLKQLPGETAWHSGGYIVTEYSPLDLAAALTAELPEVAAGTRGETVLARRSGDPDVDYTYGRSVVHDSFDDTVEQRTAGFLDAPTSGQGMITISQGISRFGPRGVVRIRIHWRDLDNDGRYAITLGPAPTALPVETKQLTAQLNSGIAEVISAIRDQRR
ncbi:ESX secretion-associated protein EspG [Nocardia sp. NBC_01329]|uniref:ESX secretion-associated protein EspG n=1 Tax=Nocardia sp. NBC_01329 TaxID=2903594 RepID=UPI002E10C103|nr:ESX secretion-associated protein EspG [Nocardia sp. NBC_01329]